MYFRVETGQHSDFFVRSFQLTALNTRIISLTILAVYFSIGKLIDYSIQNGLLNCCFKSVNQHIKLVQSN